MIPGGEEADDEKSLRNYDGDPQSREGDRNAGVEEQGELAIALYRVPVKSLGASLT